MAEIQFDPALAINKSPPKEASACKVVCPIPDVARVPYSRMRIGAVRLKCNQWAGVNCMKQKGNKIID